MMEELLKAIELRQKYNAMPLEKVVAEFEAYSGQKIPVEILNEFQFVGLSNVYFLTSDFLQIHGFKNIYGV